MAESTETAVWRQVRPGTEPRPCGRDIWGNSFVHNGSLYLFGGAWERYGRSRHQRDHGRLGTSDDLWRFDPQTEDWTLQEADRWSLDYGPQADRPGSRLLGSFAVVGDYAYLFGGLAVLEPEFVLRALNDFWRYHLPSERWELIHPDTGWCNFANRPSHPPIRGAHHMVALGHDLYLFGGWPGTVPVFTTNDLWRYDTLTQTWDQRSPRRSREQGAGYGPNAVYPGSRYCANLFAHDGALYLFSGRDTGAKSPEFFNDLWQYDPGQDLWALLQPTDDGSDFSLAAQTPAGRYASGHASLGDHLYLFGGHNGTETGVERNDFWRYSPAADRWEQIHADDGQTEYGPNTRYPGTRRVPILEACGGSLYLFGGLNCFMGTSQAGYSLPLNDLWRLDGILALQP